MTDIAIDELSLHIIRHGGWCWGAPRDRLIGAAVRALPGLIGRALSQCVGHASPDGDIDSIEVRVPLAIAELLALPTASADDADISDPASAVERRVRAALSRALAVAEPMRRSGPSAVVAAAAVAADAAGAAGRGQSAAARLARAVAAWHAAGDLGAVLARLDDAAVRALHARLFAGVDDAASRATAGRSSVLPRDGASTAGGAMPVAAERGATAAVVAAERAQIEALARRLAETPGADVVAVARAVARAHPLPAQPAALDASPPLEPATSAPAAVEVARSGATASGAPASLGARSGPRLGTVDVAHALPFVLLGPLARIGYFDIVTAGLAAAERESDAAVLAAALAHKVLDPVERGWRRTDAARLSAAAFAASAAPVADEAIEALADALDAVAPAMDLALARALVRGAGPAPNLCLGPGGAGLVLAELEGAVPIATAATWPALAAVAPATAVVSVAIDVASPSVLAAIDAGGHRFVTAAPPTRSESWRALRQPGAPRRWTNDRAADERALRQRVAAPIDVAAEVAALLVAVGPERPAVPRRRGGLEQHLTVAVASALAIAAWTLWREREPSGGRLALDRLGDLDARVAFEPGRVRVALPLGRRYQDLSERGLLADVAGVPWLGERVVAFGWG